ncbi:Protein of unknown function [Gryllus bimaculatus]|nr:Protein of unknown function [Gryllus bimaculatus]
MTFQHDCLSSQGANNMAPVGRCVVRRNDARRTLGDQELRRVNPPHYIDFFHLWTDVCSLYTSEVTLK